ncbi:hypothetical protein H7F10_11115 [Acidithiobacillus sp. HP-6]|uniref:hypothetical protein n=1 Tax=unclassified Acidithiobacillus TaxID=2614800 RepID=UPI00187A4B23|nr:MULTISPECIES: hypothetical protein [unclassified Acidithiobacillus]MBE7563489.1 hypothetical protein [Acidithiobacillus sp. HP-6]MBE7569702.1 hypothetical protein [Acidithiobacillus sp. HP-2]MDD5278932.1 hypothetical protein [Acidithiobacillus sp.]
MTGIFASAKGSLGSVLADLVSSVGQLLGGITNQGGGTQVQVGTAASVSINAPSHTGNLVQADANTAQGSTGETLSADVQGLLGGLVGGVVGDLGDLLGGVTGQDSGFALSVGSLVSIGINQNPAEASLLSLGINTMSSSSLSSGSSSSLGGL